MRFRPVQLVATGLLALPLLSLSACDDADAATREDVAVAIMKAADDAYLAGSNPTALDKVIRNLKAIAGGTKNQVATRDRLMASLQLHLAFIEMDDIQSMEATNRHDMLRLRAWSNAAARMTSFAAARESVSTAPETPHLAARREQIRSQVESVRQQSGHISAPILDAVESLKASQEEVLRLRRRAERIREEAGYVGPLQRFPLLEQAIDLERQADRIEAEMMRQEIKLDLEHRPAKAMFDRSLADLEAMLTEIDAAHTSLQEGSRQAAAAASKARQDLQAMDNQLTQMSKQVSDRFTGELATAYDTAGANLKAAAANTRKAGRGGDGRLAKEEQALLMTRIEMAQADLDVMRIHGLDEWIWVLEQLSSNDELGNRDAWKLEVDEAQKQRDELAQQAAESIDAALASAAQSKTVESTRQYLEATKTYLAGNDMPDVSEQISSTPATGSSGSTPPSTPSGGPSTGIPTPEAFVTAFNDAAEREGTEGLLTFMAANLYSASPGLTAKVTKNLEGIRMIFQIRDEAKQRFNGSLPQWADMMVNMLSMLGYARLDPASLKVTGDRATVNMEAMGESQPATLIKTPDGWKADADQEGMLPPSRNSDQMYSIFKKVLADIKSGAISSQQQLDQALQMP